MESNSFHIFIPFDLNQWNCQIFNCYSTWWRKAAVTEKHLSARLFKLQGARWLSSFFSWLNLWNSCCRRWKCFCVSCECRTAWGHTGWAQTWWTSCYLKLFLNRLNRRITSKTHKHFLIFKNSTNKNNWSHDRRPALWYGHLLFNLWLLQMYGGARGMRVRGQHLSELPWLSASSPPSTEEPRTASARPSWRPDSPWMHHADTHTHRSDLLLNDRVCLKSAWRLWSICISWYQSEWCECQITTTVAIKLFYIIR